MEWFSQYGFTLLQTISIVASLLFTAFTLRSEARERRIKNLFILTSAHREIWKKLCERPELRRILETTSPDGKTPEPTFEERLFVRSLIFHLAASFRARAYGMHFHEHGLLSDVRQFFSKPIPRAVWETMRQYQEPDFVHFVETNFK